MKLINYIKGERKGKDAHSLEKEAMRDPFLQDALDGFDAVDDDHLSRIQAIREQIGEQVAPQESRKVTLVWKLTAVAAVVLVFFVGRNFFTTNSLSNGLQAQSVIERPLDIYVPQDYYQENIAFIACMNTELTKNLSVVVDRKSKLGTDEVDQVIESQIVAPVDVYVPSM